VISQAQLKSILFYDADSGLFTRLTNRGRFKAGTVCGSVNNRDGYLRIAINGKMYLAHRLAMLFMNGEFPSFDTDHINRIRTDNRFSNLREATRSQNMQNQERALSNGKSGFLGVTKHKPSGKWLAQIRVNGKHKTVGKYDNIEDAHSAYLAAKIEIHPFYVANQAG
jgi:hypothetical protein